ncbi:hypothetical protein KL925_003870 [Ogataea polymorpha]|nr:hypothetical protein KL925_003870 [Ogataea polymorpha]
MQALLQATHERNLQTPIAPHSDTPHLRGSNYRAVFRGSGWGLERKFNTDQNSLGPLGWRSPQKSSGALDKH